ncbi:MAG TPA: tetratricopeptide repeat protein, partial [Candidatus Solibacter sp.]|nr:tetratricopeptide repeat protein [Candidatus Solibacter sp.]
MWANAQFLFRLWWQPAAAMSSILDRGSLLFASVAALGASLLLKSGVPELPGSFFTPPLILAIFYVPGTLLLSNLLGRLGALGTVFHRDYSPLLTCSAMAFAAAEIPLALAAWLIPQLLVPRQVMLYLLPLAILYFGFLMFFAVRTVFGAGNGMAASVTSLSWIPLVAAAFVWGPLTFLLRFAASPFFLFFAWYYLGGELSHLGDGLRSRQHFHRMLEAAAVNPHDGEAQYQLGLVYQQRRQYTQAIERFKNAVAIDPMLTDAHFQLGRIAREQGRLGDALAHFQTLVDQDERHHSSEVLRELGCIFA